MSDAAIGKQFEISDIPFTIIGVFKESMTDFGQSEIADQTILIPFSVARYFTGTENVKQIYFSMRNMDDVARRHQGDPPHRQFAPSSELCLQYSGPARSPGHGAQRSPTSSPRCWCWWQQSRWRWAAWAS